MYILFLSLTHTRMKHKGRGLLEVCCRSSLLLSSLTLSLAPTPSPHRGATPGQSAKAQPSLLVQGSPGDGGGHLGATKTSPWSLPVGWVQTK